MAYNFLAAPAPAPGVIQGIPFSFPPVGTEVKLHFKLYYIFIPIAILFGILVLWILRRKGRCHLNRIEDDTEFDEGILRNLSGLPTIFSYETIQSATDGFSKEIGSGGFGKVYEGILSNDTRVAVKCLLNRGGQGQKEFCAEIGTIASINHSNIVSLLGLCVEGAHRILVYEFMPNGSLDRWLFGSEKHLDWKTRYSVALDTARALAYMHEESRDCILHLDIKPQNILLDEHFKAKVADFGMARSLDRDLESRVVTQVRGTVGYMAPEWFLERGISHKSDVFSYGMVILEIISGHKNVDNSQDSEHYYFPSIAFNKVRQGKAEELIESALKLQRPADIEESFRLIKTALWCIQSNSALRPSMGMVVRMLEGDLAIMDPPFCKLPFSPSFADEASTVSLPSFVYETCTVSLGDAVGKVVASINSVFEAEDIVSGLYQVSHYAVVPGEIRRMSCVLGSAGSDQKVLIPFSS